VTPRHWRQRYRWACVSTVLEWPPLNWKVGWWIHRQWVNRTMKRSLHHWDHIIIRFIVTACYMQYIYIFLVKDGDTTRNLNIYKCLHL